MRTLIRALVAISAVALLAGCGGNAGTATAQDHNTQDVTFATDMIPHHRQAVEMANLAATRASGREVLQLAQDIAGAQEPEIQIMSGWLEQWGEPLPADMSGMDMGSGAMTGMMTQEQMQALEAATGTAFDQMFLEMMVEHHNGAIDMAQTEQSQGKYQPAIDLAAQIEQAQQAEVATMHDILGTNG